MRSYGITAESALQVRSRLIYFAGILLITAGCVSEPVKRDESADASLSAPKADGLLIVDCLLPGRIQRLGSKTTYLTARQPIQTTAQDCEIRGGEYTAYDRATYATALKVWLPKAQEGDADAQNKVGAIYEKGLGGSPDYEMAALWYRRAAAQGFTRAQINLGFLYEKGLGVPKDDRAAFEWYRKASDLPEAVVIDKGELDQARLQLARLRQSLDDTRAHLKQARSERQQLQREMQQAPEAQQRVEQELERQRRELARRGDLIQELEAQSRDQREKLLSLETRGSIQREQLALAHQQLGRIRDDLKHYNDLAAKSAGELDRARSDLVRTRGRLPEKGADDKRILALEMALRDREQELWEQKEMVAQLSAALEQWRRKVEELEHMERSADPRETDTSMQAGLPLAPPSIQLIEPPLVMVRGGARIPVKGDLDRRVIVGQVVAPAGLYALTLNGARLSVDAKGLFSTEVVLRGDVTQIEVAAVDGAGKRSSLAFELVTEGYGESMAAKGTSRLRGVEFGNYHALVIGNRDYRAMPDLKTSQHDAEVMAELLRERFGFKTTLLIDATRYQILSELNRLRKQLTSKDNLLIYYAGHGELDEVNLRGHWLPVDAETDNTANWISNVSITDILNVMKVLHVLVIADSCYSGALTRSALANIEAGATAETRSHWVRALAQMQSRTAFSSGGLEPVLDGGGGAHSMFAKALINVLRNLDGVAEGQRVYREVAARVAYESDEYQVPQYAPIKFSGHESGDFLFVPKIPL